MTENLFLTILGIIGSFGIVQVLVSRDGESIAKCRLLSFELKRLLEELADSTNDSQNDLLKLKEIKKVIEQFYVEKEGLAFSCYLLNHLLEQSLPLFDALRSANENPARKSDINTQLLTIWGLEPTQSFRTSSLLEVQKFLFKPYYKRFFTRMFQSRCISLSSHQHPHQKLALSTREESQS